MFSTLITVAPFVSLAIRGASAIFAISTPNFTQCEPAEVSWQRTEPPYKIEVVPANDPCGDALDIISNLTSTVLDYVGNITSGTEVVLYISDSTGNEAWSGNITVGASSNNTCITGVSSTVVLSNTTTPAAQATHSDSNSSSTSGGALGGAINAQPNPLEGGALSVRQATVPLLSITTLVAMLALTL